MYSDQLHGVRTFLFQNFSVPTINNRKRQEEGSEREKCFCRDTVFSGLRVKKRMSPVTE